MRFVDDSAALLGKHCLRFTPDPYPGAFATAIYPAKRNAAWNLSAKRQISFWIRAENPNLPGFQNAGPVVRLLGQHGQLEFQPAKDANLLNDPPFSEARWLWMPVVIPIEGNAEWQRTMTGSIDLGRVEALSLSLDSWGWEPFTIWLDGLTVE
jgi:hypothetical protein